MKMNKHGSFFTTTLTVTLLIVAGKLLGFGRETLIAGLYGATAETDALFFAQSMPAMIFPAVCSSVSTAFISLYTARLATEDPRSSDRYASRTLLATSILASVLAVIGVLLSPILVPLFAPGFQGSQLSLAIRLTRLTMGMFLITMMQYMLGAILNSHKYFIGSQVAGLFYNLVIILVTVFLGPGQSMEVLMLTIILGHAAQLVCLIYCCHGCFHLTLRLNPLHQEIKQLWTLSLPILLGNSVVQLNTIVDKALGSILPEGSLSALSYGNTLTALITSIFIMSLSTVLYPTLTSNAASGDMDQYGQILMKNLSGLTLLLIPISCITLLFAQDIVKIVYGRGNFDQTAVANTGAVLACYAPIFLFSGIREILSRVFFSLQDTKTPMQNSAIGVGCNILFSLLLVHPLGIKGIALGTTISALITTCLMLWSVCRELPTLPIKCFFRETFAKGLLAAGILLLLLWGLRCSILFSAPLLRFVCATVLGGTAYLCILLILREPTLRALLRQLFHKDSD